MDVYEFKDEFTGVRGLLAPGRFCMSVIGGTLGTIVETSSDMTKLTEDRLERLSKIYGGVNENDSLVRPFLDRVDSYGLEGDALSSTDTEVDAKFIGDFISYIDSFGR